MRQMDNAIRGEIRRAMVDHNPETLNDCVEQSMLEAMQIGYDMTNAQGRATLPVCTAIVTTPVAPRRIIEQVSVVPRFAASCALLLRARLGRLPPNEANHLLVQREYLKICRTRGVRAVDIVAHQQHVANAFFTEDVLDRVALTRSRWPRWMRTLFDSSEFNSGPTAC